MLACLDVDYREQGAVAAVVAFREWPDANPLSESTATIVEVQPYQPGQFFRREMPCLLAALAELKSRPDVVVIDGYVWLGDESAPGLGAHLFEAMERRIAIIGVAKTKYAGAMLAREILRGNSLSPLFITAVGMDLSEAAGHIADMHGPHRIPTLPRRVDQLCRGFIAVQAGANDA